MLEKKKLRYREKKSQTSRESLDGLRPQKGTQEQKGGMSHPTAKDRLGVPSDKLTLRKHKTLELKETCI